MKNAPFYGGCKVGLAKEIVSCAQQHHVAQCASCATIAIREGMYIDEVEVSDTRLEQGMKLTVSNEGNQIIHHSRYRSCFRRRIDDTFASGHINRNRPETIHSFIGRVLLTASASLANGGHLRIS